MKNGTVNAVYALKYVEPPSFVTNAQNSEYNYSWLLYWQYLMLVNIKVDISGCNSITFQGCRFHWFSSFLMAQLERNW